MALHPISDEREAPVQLLAHTHVRAVMQFGLFECEPDADLRTLARTMADRSVHAVVVPGVAGADAQGGRLAWGIVSDIELMRALQPGREPATAGELARTHAVAVLPTDTLARATQLMAEHDTAHLVVVSPETGRPVGMVSSIDIAGLVGGS